MVQLINKPDVINQNKIRTNNSDPALPDAAITAPPAETYVGLHVIAPMAATEPPREAVLTTDCITYSDHFTLDPIDTNIKYSQSELPENLNHYVSMDGGHESEMIEKPPLDDIQYLSLLSKANKKSGQKLGVLKPTFFKKMIQVHNQTCRVSVNISTKDNISMPQSIEIMHILTPESTLKWVFKKSLKVMCLVVLACSKFKRSGLLISKIRSPLTLGLIMDGEFNNYIPLIHDGSRHEPPLRTFNIYPMFK